MILNHTQDGIASPNPDYPQEVKVVTGDNNVVVRGRNINPTTTRVGLYLIADGTFSSTTTSYITVGDLIPLDYNKTITCSNEKSKSGSWYMLEYDKDKNYLYQNQLLTGSTATFTTQNPLTKYVAIDLGGGINLENAGEIMIETGSTAHSYEPYQSQSYPISLASKNLLKNENGSKTINGITITQNSDGSLTINGTASGEVQYFYGLNNTQNSFSINASTTYSLSITNNFPFKAFFRIRDMVDSSVFKQCQNAYGTDSNKVENISGSFFTSGTACAQLYIYSGETANNFTIYPQFEESPTATEYAPYFDPIELAKISTYKDYIKRSTGKNLFDKNTTNKLNANYSNGVITANANERMAYIECEPNTTYTLSKLIPSSYIRNTIGTTQTIPADGVTLEDAVYSATSPKTITTNANAKYLVWLYYSASDAQYTEQQTLDSMQIELGSSATSLEPYGKGKWYTYKATGKVVLDGTESWNKSGASTSSLFIGGVILSLDNKKENNLVCISDYFQTNGPWQLNNLWFYVDGTAIGIGMDANTITDITAFTNWLSTHNTTVYYPLATPTVTEITDETLISQLEAVKLLSGTQNNFTIDVDTLPTLNLNYIGEANPHL